MTWSLEIIARPFIWRRRPEPRTHDRIARIQARVESRMILAARTWIGDPGRRFRARDRNERRKQGQRPTSTYPLPANFPLPTLIHAP